MKTRYLLYRARLAAVALGIVALGVASACGAVLVRPPRTTVPPVATRADLVSDIPTPSSGSERSVSPAPRPSPTAGLLAVTFSEAPVQFWSNPNDISALLIADGDIWAATYGGVVRWDSAGDYTIYTARDGLASEAVRGIAQAGDGRIWVGHEGAVAWSSFDGSGWQAHADREEAVEAFYGAMMASKKDDPRLWAHRTDGTWLWLPRGDGRIEAYDGSRWRIYGPQHGVRSGSWGVSVAPTGQVWAVGSGISTAQEGEVWWDDHDYFSEVGDAHEVTGMVADLDGSLWISYAASAMTSGRAMGPSESLGGIARYNLALNRWEGYLNSMNEAIPPRVYDIRRGSGDTLWVAGQGAVASRRPLRPWEGLSVGDLVVRCVAADDEGRLWLGTAKGLWSMRQDGTDLQGPWLTPSPLLDSEVIDLAIDAAGRLVVATARGASTLSSTGVAEVVMEEAILCAADSPTGELWLGTAVGLYRIDAQGKAARASDEVALALAFDAQGQLWICTEQGAIGRFGHEPLLNIRELAGELPRNMAFDSAGALWMSVSQGVGVVTPDGAWAIASDEEALLSPDVRRIAVGPDGTVWAATARGLARRLPNGRWTRFTVESTGKGLQSADMRDVRLDAEGTLWMTTAAGVSRRSADADWATVSLPGARWVLPDPQGVVWVGTNGGLYRVRPEAFVATP